MKNIVLVGFMGTGKSVVGQALAGRLKRSFLDLDAQIEKETGRPIAEIFAKEGEAVFRRREAEAVEAAARLEGAVVATGGGVVLNEKNVQLLKQTGTLICLCARPEVILKRAYENLPSRPLLEGGAPAQRVKRLLKERAPYYAKASASIDTSDKTVGEVVEEIIALVSKE